MKQTSKARKVTGRVILVRPCLAQTRTCVSLLLFYPHLLSFREHVRSTLGDLILRNTYSCWVYMHTDVTIDAGPTFQLLLFFFLKIYHIIVLLNSFACWIEKNIFFFLPSLALSVLSLCCKWGISDVKSKCMGEKVVPPFLDEVDVFWFWVVLWTHVWSYLSFWEFWWIWPVYDTA